MTELQLYKFLFDKNGFGCEIKWILSNTITSSGHLTENYELICLISIHSLCDFTEMIKSFLNDNILKTELKGGYIGFDLVPICEYYDIDPEKILEKEV